MVQGLFRPRPRPLRVLRVLAKQTQRPKESSGILNVPKENTPETR